MKIGGLLIGDNLSRIVTNANTLKAMAKRGHFEFPITTGQPYVDEKDNPRIFNYNNDTYEIEYKSGCFFPFVVKK
jgi:hypothetical protein